MKKPNRLPVVNIKFFLDKRLKELRMVNNPHIRIHLDEQEGEEKCYLQS